jgi:glycosyltransferase involved in cell wall biosynthesis
MIAVCEKVQDFKCAIRMYEIIFTKKQHMFEKSYIKDILYNLQFFLQFVSPENNKTFIELTNNYIDFLHLNNVNIQHFDFLKNDFYINAGLNIDKYFPKQKKQSLKSPQTLKSPQSQKFSKNECMSSKNILIFSGFCDVNWNYSFMLNKALGGSEKSVAYISRCFPKDYQVFITGCVTHETIENVTYIPLNNLTQLIENTPFNTLIVSRYISFYEMFQKCSFYQSYIWAHDTELISYGCSFNVTQILNKWNNYINGCICLTEWHKNLFIEKYPILNNKINIINNGIDINSFKNINKTNKIKNKFIYTSRPERGLNILLNLWPQILEKIPDATLSISSYVLFPSNPQDVLLKNIIDKTDSITYLGNLKVDKLYEEMSSSEYWLYPTHYPETSCITALEMLMSEVICLYYPVAGLPYTIDKYGIQVTPNSEINTIVSLTDEQKRQLRKNGKLYANSCSWKIRAKSWTNMLFNNNNLITNVQKDNKITILFIIPSWYITEHIVDYMDSLNTIYNVIYTKDLNYAYTLTPNKALFVYEIINDVYNYFTNKNIEVSLLNLEPLNLQCRFNNINNYLIKYPGIKVYDYSKSNIKILHNI